MAPLIQLDTALMCFFDMYYILYISIAYCILQESDNLITIETKKD